MRKNIPSRQLVLDGFLCCIFVQKQSKQRTKRLLDWLQSLGRV